MPLYKGKGSRSECSNYRGITLLSAPGKVFARLLFRIKHTLLSHRHVQQSAFMLGRSTCDRILTLCNIVQQRQTYGCSTYAAYVDLRVAFDSISRPALWLLLKKGRCTREVRHTNQGFVRHANCLQSTWFEIMSGVRQGCVMSPDSFATGKERAVGIGMNGMSRRPFVHRLGLCRRHLRARRIDGAIGAGT